MAKSKRKRSRIASVEPELAARHGFDSGGFLGHESTYSVNVTEQVSLAVDTVFACVRIISDLVADADIGEFRDTERLTPSRLTLRPMQSITRRTWLWMTASTMALYNGVYLWRRFGRDSEGVTRTLQPLAPSRVQWESASVVRVDGERVDPDTLRWVPRMTFPTLTRELSYLIRLAREAIASSWAADSYSSDFWQSGGPPAWYAKSDQALSKGDAEQIKESIVTARQASPGTPMVLGKGSEIKPLGVDLTAAGVGDAKSKTGAAIARYFGVPAWLANVPTEAGSLAYSNSAAAGLDLVRYTLQPGYAGPIGDALSDELPGDYLVGRRVVLDLTHLTRGTILEQAQAYQIATGGRPWMLPSEVRADLHMPMDMALDESGAPAPAMEVIA